jgi:hypothetical protein
MAKWHHEGIIVLGLPRSGTTLVRRLLNSHPSISCPGENFLLRGAARFIESERIAYGIDYGVLGGLSSLGLPEEVVLSKLRSMTFDMLREIAKDQGKPRWATKTAVESFYIDAIERIYGKSAYFICVLRHGLDVVCSLKEFCDEIQGYVAELHRYVQRYPRPLEAFAHAWADVSGDLADFVDRHPENAILCRYEDLVKDPEATLQGVLEFVGADWDPNMLAEAFTVQEVKGLGDWKTYAKSGIDEASVERWHALSDAALPRLAAIVNPMLARLGYDQVDAGQELSTSEAMRKYELAMALKSIRAQSGTP